MEGSPARIKNSSGRKPFWETTPPEALTARQWEALCDRCGRCCLEKLINPRTGKVYYTSIACALLDKASCQCRDYRHRRRMVPQCIQLNPANLMSCRWLPRTCAYRLLGEGKNLPAWHPLISGNPESVHAAGISIRGRVLHPMPPHADDLEAYIVDWGIWSKKTRGE
jgi:uncharacterized cysteine cluster protein YcgN (CxxCxxCC family)